MKQFLQGQPDFGLHAVGLFFLCNYSASSSSFVALLEGSNSCSTIEEKVF